MTKKASASTFRLLFGILIGASIALIGLAVWMITKNEGAPVFVALAGAMLAASAVVVASQTKKKL